MRLALLLGLIAFPLAALVIAALTSHHIPAHGAAAVYLSAARSGLYIGLAVGGCTYALRCGGAPERAIGAVIIASVVVDPLLHLVLPLRFGSVDPTHLLIDAGCLIAFGAVGLHAHRHWPLWLTAFQLLALGAHLTKAMGLDIHPVVYSTMTVMWSYGMLVLLLSATWHHQRLLGRGVIRKSWSDFSRRSTSMPTGSPAISSPASPPSGAS